MGGRLLDYIAQGVAASRPAAAGMPALIQAGGASIYYANDTLIFSFFNDDTVAWDELDIGALTGLFADLADVDWTTPPTDGQIFEWDTATSKLIPVAKPAGFTDELAQDALATAFAAGSHSGLTITYDDGTNKFDFAVTITQYTDELAQDAVGAAFAVGTHVGVTVTYDDASGLFDVEIVEASSSEMWTGTSQVVVVTPKKVFDMAAPVSAAYGATVTLDLNTGLSFDIGTLTGPITLANFTNAKAGQSGMIHLVQDGTGGHVITYGSNFVCAGGLAANGVLSTVANKIDELTYFVRTDGKIVVSLLKDVKA